MSDSSAEQPRLVLVVALYVRPGRERELREFEARAAVIMRKHGGVIERVFRPDAGPPEVEAPYEIHLVTFPGRDAFAAYRSDAELAALAPLRELAIARTEITVGREGEPYR